MVSPSTDRRLGLNGNTAVKAPVALAIKTPITLLGEQTIQGVTTNASRVLVAGQADGKTNGIYDTSSGVWTRAFDANGVYDLVAGTLVVVFGGSYALSYFQVTTANPITIGTTSLTFTQVPGTDAAIILYNQLTTYLIGSVGFALGQTLTAKSAGCDTTGDVYTALAAAIAEASSRGAQFEFTAGRTYQLGSPLIFPSGLKVKTHGAILEDLNGTTSNTAFVTVLDDVDMDRLVVSIPTGKRRDRAVTINGNRDEIGSIELTSVDQQANTGETFDSAIRLVSINDTRIGYIKCSGYDNSVNLETCNRTSIGGVSITNYVRGLWLFDNQNIFIGKSHIRTASVNAVLVAGNNGVLMGCNSDYAQAYVTLEDFTVENSGEHAIRIGGAFSHIGVHVCRPKIKDPGACGIKILGTDTAAPTEYNEGIWIEDALIEDCGTSLTAGANRVGIMAEFAKFVKITNPVIRQRNNIYCASYGIRINGCEDVTISNPTIQGAQFDDILLHATDGALTRIHINGGNVRTASRYGLNLLVDGGKTATDMVIDGLTVTGNINTGINIANAGTLNGGLVSGFITSTLGSSGIISNNSNNIFLQITGATTTTTGVSAANGSWWQTGNSLNYRSSGAWTALT